MFGRVYNCYSVDTYFRFAELPTQINAIDSKIMKKFGWNISWNCMENIFGQIMLDKRCDSNIFGLFAWFNRAHNLNLDGILNFCA